MNFEGKGGNWVSKPNQGGIMISKEILLPLIIGLLINVLTPSIVQKPYFITVLILSLILALLVISTRGRYWRIISGFFTFILLLLLLIGVSPSPPSPPSMSFRITSPVDGEYVLVDVPFDIKGIGNQKGIKLTVKEKLGANTYCDSLNNKTRITNNGWVFPGCQLTQEGDYIIFVESQEIVESQKMATQDITITAKDQKELTFQQSISNSWSYLVNNIKRMN